jgi:predicted lipoprotein with Yx(FWY)xxD motif
MRAPRDGALGACAAFAALAVVGCGGGGAGGVSAGATARQAADTAQPPAATQRPVPSRRARAAPALVRVRDSRYGRILVDARGKTLYLFTADSPSATRCAGACAGAWPPYTVASSRLARASASAHAVGRLRRGDGSSQVTYHGHPLYYYVGDRLPGQILCQDVEEYDGHWWIVSPRGTAVTGGARA